MKKFISLLMASFMLVMAVPAFAAADLSGIVIEDYEATPDLSVSGYPRFEQLHDGTLLLVNSGTIRHSNDNGATWKRYAITQNSAATVTTASGTTHNLSRENWQGFVLDNGTVMVAYRSRTKDYVSGEFYTSIRVMTSTDGGKTFANEVIVAEQTAKSFNGFWEPFMVQLDSNTVAMYYSDDLNVSNSSSQQNIVYHLYNIKEGTWGSANIAVNGAKRNSRDGMPVVTKLYDGGYAMVIETFDYFNRTYNGVYGNSVFVVGLALSADGKVWSDPVPVVAPANITGGDRCAAPYITTLPDGRVIISYMTEDGYTGARNTETAHCNCVYGAVVSDAPLASDTVLTATTGGAANGFTALPDLFEDAETGYMVWNTVERVGKYVYFAGSANQNNGEGSASVRIRRADVSALMPDTDIDNDGAVTLKDALLCFKQVFGAKGLLFDIDGNGVVGVSDALLILKDAMN